MHADARMNDDAPALGQCALQYHAAHPEPFSSFNCGDKEAETKGTASGLSPPLPVNDTLRRCP